MSTHTTDQIEETHRAIDSFERTIEALLEERRRRERELERIDAELADAKAAQEARGSNGRQRSRDGDAREAPSHRRNGPKEPEPAASAGGPPAASSDGKREDEAEQGARTRRRGGPTRTYKRTGRNSLLMFIRSRGVVTTAEANEHWRREGRVGRADPELTMMVREGILRREPRKRGAGSVFSLAKKR